MMKKVWAVLLAIMMLLNGVSALAEGTDEESNPQDTGDAPQPKLAKLSDCYSIEIPDGGRYVLEEKDGHYIWHIKNSAETDTGTFTLEPTEGDNKYSVLTILGGAVKVTGTTPENGVIIINDTELKTEDSTIAYDEIQKTISIMGGMVEASTKGQSSDSIIISEDSILTLAGVDIKSTNQAAITINTGISAKLVLSGENTVEGYGDGYRTGYAGIEVAFIKGEPLSSLNIEGDGFLTAIGGTGSAGIGGSLYSVGTSNLSQVKGCFYGNIIIEGGNITAIGTAGDYTGGAGIGSSGNNYPASGYPYRSMKINNDYWGSITINGGNITATGQGNAAGIGGGNHVDSGKVYINYGTITAKGHTGIGSGLGSSKEQKDTEKGPGCYYADVNISGGIITAIGSKCGAGIGGGQYCDAIVSISGGNIVAKGESSGSLYQGGAGIGGGYQGAAIITISGGNIIAEGGNGAPGIGNGADQSGRGNSSYTSVVRYEQKSIRTNPTVTDEEAIVNISGGKITATGGVYAAGIGGGYSSTVVRVNISGGDITARGYGVEDENCLHSSGAGIGSGVGKNGLTIKPDYESYTFVCDISIGGGTVTSIGGWGSAGIGSGADNFRATSIEIGSGATVKAYSDGTKFALDTRDGSNTSVDGDVIQGTFMFPWEASGDITQDARGLKHVTVTNEETGETKEISLPDGYRSFAANVSGQGKYTIYSTDSSIANGNGAFFSASTLEGKEDASQDPAPKTEGAVLLGLSTGTLSDNFFLYPVKTIVVEKIVNLVEGLEESDLNMTATFKVEDKNDSSKSWEKSIEIVNGKPVGSGRAVFENIPNGAYDIWEMDGDEHMQVGKLFGAAELKKIETSSSTGSDNNGSISDDKYNDKVTVTNTFGLKKIDDEVVVIAPSATKMYDGTALTEDGTGEKKVIVSGLPEGYSLETTVEGSIIDVGTGKNVITAYKILNPNGKDETSRFTKVTKQDGELTVTKRKVVLTSESASKDYDRRALQSRTVTESGDGFVKGEAADITANGTVTHVEEGEVANTISYRTMGRFNANNYEITLNEGTLKILPVPLTITTGSASKLYDGTPLTRQEQRIEGLVSGDNVTVRANGTITEVGTTKNTYEIDWKNTSKSDYTVSEQLGDLTILPVLDITVTKVWNDNDNQDGIRQQYVLIHLLADGEVVQSQRLTETENNWSYTFKGLPELNDGEPVDYTVTEDAVTGYTTAITGNSTDGFTVTNTHTPDTTEVTVTKVWDDNSNQDGVRPDRVTIRLTANGEEVRSAEVTGTGDSWSYTFTGLPKNSAGRAIAYAVTEDAVTGYTTTITGTMVAGFTVTNTHTPDTTEVTVTKVWNDNDNQDAVRPARVTVRLLAEGTEVRSAEITGAGSSWSHTFTDLPRNSAGRAIAYTITEDTVDGYTAAITGTAATGFTVTNTHTPDTTEVTVTKAWNDNSNQDGVRPENVTIRLLANGTEIRNAEITGTGDSWTYTFADLPRNSAGRAINYTIIEDAVTGYTTAITGTMAAGFTVTNTHTPDTTEVSVTKVWDDSNNQDAVRPTRVTIRLMANDTEVRSTEITGTGDSWSYTFTDLPRNSNGRAITYTIAEDAVTGYTTAITGTAAEGFTVTNTLIPATTEVTVIKTWNDNSNQDGIRPETVTIRLMANGTEVRSAEITGTGDSWSYTFSDLTKNSAGSEIAYTVSEDTVDGYTATISGTAADGFTVTNTHTPDTTEVTVTKVWNDNSNQDGVRPENVTIRLLANGTEVRSAEITGTGDSWSYTFADLPRNNAGQAIVYTVAEDPVTGYTTAITGTAADGFTVTNTHEPAAIQVTVAKVWNDNNNQDGIRPAAVTVNLMANGTQVRTQRVTGNGNRWTYTFTDLPQFENGTEIAYTVNENAVTGYTAAITGTAAAGFTLTNNHAPEVISVSGRKTWADQNNTDGIRPASITVHLLADGRQTETRTVTDDTYTFENLPRFINGREIVYSISEDPVEGYTTEINGYDLTNRHTPLRVSVNGAKVWGDHENRDGLRPQAITVHLLADGQEVGTQRVTGTGDRWTYSFSNLPAYADGKLVQYTVTEDAVEGYETTIVGHEIYNIHRNEDPQEDPELYTLTVRYWADGQTAFPDFRGTYEFGAMYSVVSPEKPGYTVDLEVVAGVIVEDTVIDVYYTPKPVTLTIYYQYMDGSIAADTYFDTLMPGDPYDVVSPVIEGYTATQLRVEGTMPNRNVEFVVWYLPETEPDPETGRTRIPGGYTKIDEYGVPLGLGEVNRNAGECYE